MKRPADFPAGGLIHVTGENDSGKTTFAITCGVPLKRILFMDHDLKTSALDIRKSFGQYVDLNALRSEIPGEDEFFLAAKKYVDDVKENQFDVLIWDNFTPFEDGFYPYISKNPNQWRTNWSSMGAIKGAQMWDVSFQYEAAVLAEWMRKIPMIFIITHLKDHMMNKVKTGRKVPAGKRVVPEKANFRVWLRPNERGAGEPIGLILKRIGKTVVDKEGIPSIVNVLPRKMVPCTWAEIYRYWNEPFGESDPRPDQVPNAHELGVLSGHLTADQRKIYELALKYGAPDEDEEVFADAPSDEQVEFIKGLEGTPPGILLKQVKEKFPDDNWTLERISTILKG